MRFLFERVKTVAEPSGACALAALLAGRVGDVRGLRVGVTISGGNVTAARFAELVRAAPSIHGHGLERRSSSAAASAGCTRRASWSARCRRMPRR